MINNNFNLLSKVVIAPPFGNYIKLPNTTTSVLGSFTVNQRKGLLMQVLKTFRFYQGGYINKIGLRNKGLVNFNPKPKLSRHIISLAALENDDWQAFATILNQLYAQHNFKPYAIELNLSCPNVNHLGGVSIEYLKLFSNYLTILKLPPTSQCLDFIDLGLNANINLFHMCNTLPSPKGGISGTLLKEQSLKYIDLAKTQYGDKIKIIGGGGIYSKQDVDDYAKLKVDYFSLATVALNPCKFIQLINYINRA